MSVALTKRTEPALLFAFFLGGCLSLYAQDSRGVIGGRVTDSSGAIVPAALVLITSDSTTVSVRGNTNQEGIYESQYLLPGFYSVLVEHTGFKKWSRQRVELLTSGRQQVDARLEPGNVVETVEVTGLASGIESSRATVDQVLTAKEVSNLPVRNGSIGYLFGLAPGVVMTSLPKNGPWAPGGNNGFSIGGGSSIDFNLDGVSNNSVGGQTSMLPPPELVEEVQILTNGYDASVGHSSGGAVNITLKSGTNKLHGSLGFSMSDGPMMTRDFFTNRFIYDPTTGPVTQAKIDAGTPPVYWMRSTVAAGGPLVIPRVYDGHQRTFWMLGFQAQNKSRAVSSLDTVPSTAQRNGDFSALLGLGSQYQIYDPFSTVPSGAQFKRNPLPNNIVPASQINVGAKSITKYYPMANATGTSDGLQNFSTSPMQPFDLYQPILRVDHNFTERNRAYFRYSQSLYHTENIGKTTPDSKVTGRTQERPHRGVAADDVLTLSPNAVLDIRYGLTSFFTDVSYDSNGWDLSEFGFPSGLLSQLSSQRRTFPQTAVAGLMTLGSNGGSFNSEYSHNLLAVLSWMKKGHSLKFGFDGRLLYSNNYSFGNVSPQLSFAATYTNGPLSNAAASPGFGQSMAGFLYGIPTSGGVDANSSSANMSKFFAPYIQDDWRIGRRLTLNIGLRWEYEGPLTERFNRTSRQFDFVSPSPIEQAAQAQYARNPISGLPPSQFRVPGGVTFVNLGGNARGVHDPDFRVFMPRFGFAYQLRPTLVMRGGYGIFYGLIGAEFDNAAQPGFSQRTNVVPTLDGGVTYVASISNPLPGPIQRPVGASAGLLTFAGASPGFFDRDGRRPYTQRWSYSLQTALTNQTALELGYIGSRSVRLRITRQFDSIPAQYLSTSPERDANVINFLSSKAVNPFLGLPAFAGTALYSSQTTNYSQLLLPFPQFTALAADIPSGSSWYHAMTIRLQQRLSHGLQFNTFFTWSKNMQATSYLNPTDSNPEHVISELDRPHRFVVSAIYALPFGKAAPAMLRHVIGGWTLDTIYQLQSGPAINFGNVLFRGDIHDIPLTGQRSPDLWLNTADFEKATGKQLANNIRTFPSRLSGVRADGINMLDLALHKNFRLTERFKLQLRGEAEGILNHPLFAAPNAVPTSTLFGAVSATQTSGDEARRIFVGLKLNF